MRGLGLSYRPQLDGPLLAWAGRLDFLERVEGDAWSGRTAPWRDLPWVTHSVEHSPAAVGDSGRAPLPTDPGLVFSDHLSFSRAGGLQVENFLPCASQAEGADAVSRWIADTRRSLPRDCRLALENPCLFFAWPGEAPGADTALLARIAREHGIAVLLDVNNLWINACNQRFDPFAALGLFRDVEVAYLHVAGDAECPDGVRVDSHGSPVRAEVWELARAALRRTSARAIVLERDLGLERADEAERDLGIAAGILAGQG